MQIIDQHAAWMEEDHALKKNEDVDDKDSRIANIG